MNQLLHQLISHQAKLNRDKKALGFNLQWLTYEELDTGVTRAANALVSLDLKAHDRVAIYLPKCLENVISMFATSKARGVFVPLNPLFKEPQVAHVLQDSGAKLLVTSYSRWLKIRSIIPGTVEKVIVTDLPNGTEVCSNVTGWDDFIATNSTGNLPQGLETDLAAIFYTSGSTGKAKGVMLSQRNMVLGAYSVANYLQSDSDDRLLAVQPLSFDYGFSQLTITFATGGSCYLMEYLFPQDIIKLVSELSITGLALVPPLWIKLAELEWPEKARNQLRYFTNTGGAMPQTTLKKLRNIFPQAKPYLMYGLTEAFRSCYLPPEEIDNKPGSFGKAIPNVEVHVINQHGELCQPDEKGELVHSGPLVSLGYWRNNEKMSERFKPLPQHISSLSNPPLAVWSGDIVTKDKDGYLYFVGRRDDMIKTSGYRVSPVEIEEVLYKSPAISEAVAIGIPHAELGQVILAVIVTNSNCTLELQELNKFCMQFLPSYMLPHKVIVESNIGRNANGKLDRQALFNKYQNCFQD